MRITSLVIAIFLLFSFGLIRSTSAQTQGHVGLINLRLAYSNLQQTIDIQREITSLQGQLDQLTQGDRDDLKDKSKTTEQRDQQQMDSATKEQALKLKMIRLQAKALKTGYDQIQSVVPDLAKQRNFDLVLVSNDFDLSADADEQLNVQTLGEQIFNRSVLYAGDQIDITTEVIARVNQTYKTDYNPKPLPTATMQIGSKTYQLEIAGDDASREHGLMERDTLPSDHGMIFVFPDAAERNFWMYHTRFPLDIIYADAQGRVISIDSMKPYDQTTPHFSNGPAKYAIELSVGQSKGITLGQKLAIPAAVSAALPK